MQRKGGERRVFGYARVSSVEQTVGTSLDDQRRAIESEARQRGVTVTRMYTEAESAVHEKIERRVQILSLLAEVRSGDLILVYRLDRWSRDPEFTYRSVRELLAKGVAFYAIDDRCDPSTPEGDSTLGFRILFAREEHKRIKQRMVGTRKLLKDQGYFADGSVPRGYRRAGGKGVGKNILVVVEEEAATVREVFAMSAAGSGLSEIAFELDIERSLVHDTLRNRHYLGEVRNSRGEWIRGKHDAIIDAATFVRSESTRAARRKQWCKAPDAEAMTAAWWLRDVARCGLCGGKMTSAYGGEWKGKRSYYLRCRKRCIRKHVEVFAAERAAEPLVLARLAELRAELERPPAVERSRISTATIAGKRDALAKKRDRYLEAFADGHIDRGELAKKLAALDTERTQLDALESPAKPVSKTARVSALRTVSEIASGWKRMGGVKRRELVRTIARQVFLAPGEAPRFEWVAIEDLTREHDR